MGRKEQLNRRQKRLEGQGEAHPVSSTGQGLIALAWAEPPEGRTGWRLRLLADRLVECEVVESISPETVRQTLKETNSRPRSATGPALAERVLAHPAGRECGVRVRDGGRAGSLPSPVKSTIASRGTRKFWCAWTRPASNRAGPGPRPGVKGRQACGVRHGLGQPVSPIRSMSARA